MTRWFTFALALMVVPIAASAAPPAGKKATTAKHATSAKMKPKISADSARVIASAKVPGGTVKSQELEREHGHLIYSFDFEVPGKSGIDEVNVDAMNGKVLAVQHEGVKAEPQEKAQEKKEAESAKKPH